MKTFADVKRRAIVGTRLEVVAQTIRPELVGTIRTITKVSSGPAYRFTSSHKGNEEYRTLWPPASQVRIVDADTFEYEPQRGKGDIIRLRFLAA